MVCVDGDSFDEAAIYENAVRCRECGLGFDVIWGVPFLGQFAQSDILSLIEIASNADNYSRKQNAVEQSVQGSEVTDYVRWQDLLEGYHLSSDREAYLADHGISPQVATWFPNRYAEHVYFRALTASVPLQGKRVLDVGAGPGFDSCKFVRAGSSVTCVEFSPILAHEGLRKVPKARWFGGNSNALPFREGQFDLVVANAALHHMKDIPKAIEEMLRVLRPDGYMITLCDSYRKTGSSEDVEIEVFKSDPAVLMGVNEGIPPFGEFISALSRHRDRLDIEVITSEVHGLQSDRLARGLRLPKVGKRNLPYPRQWSFDEAIDLLSNTSGGLALRVRLKQPLAVSSPKRMLGTIKPADFARALDSQSHGIAKLAAYMPEEYIDLSLLGSEHAKFRLLNGWKLPETGLPYRAAFGRARSFHACRGKDDVLRVDVLLPHITKRDKPEVVIQVNGVAVARRSSCRGLWTEIVAQASGLEPGAVAAVEIRIETTLGDSEARTFRVRECGFTSDRRERRSTETELDHFGLEALAHLDLIGPSPIPVIFGSDYGAGVATINQLRELGIAVRAVVLEEQVALFGSEPGVEIIRTYKNDDDLDVKELHEPGRTALIVAPDLHTAHRMDRLVGLKGIESRCFVVLPGGHAVRKPSRLRANASSGIARLERLKELLLPVKRIVGAIRRGAAWSRP
jgi:SAM-dependent methyltransferase